MRLSHFTFSRAFLPTAFLFASLCFTSACAKKDDTDKSEESSAVSAALDVQLEAVGKSFIPKSLDSGGVSLVGANLIDVCDTLFFGGECQTALLKTYIAVAKVTFEAGRAIVSGIGKSLDEAKDGTKATFEEGDKTFFIDKSSGSSFKVLGKYKDKSFLYIVVEGKSFDLRVNNEANDNPSDSGAIQVKVDFTDADSWVADIFVNKVCNPAAPKENTAVRIRMGRESALWTGKAQIFAPLAFAAAPTCETASNESVGVHVNTDFVANDTAAKSAIYVMPSSVATAAAVEDFPASKTCETFGGVPCGGSRAELTDIKNPSCLKAADGTIAYSSSCATVSEPVAKGAFSEASLWVAPKTYSVQRVSLPSTLE